MKPLDGILVLTLEQAVAAPLCSCRLADAGARVIKVEPPGGDPMRRIGPFIYGRPVPAESLHWLHFNTNKRSITLNIASAQGADLLRRIAAKADILLETFAPGYLDSLGLGHERLGGPVTPPLPPGWA